MTPATGQLKTATVLIPVSARSADPAAIHREATRQLRARGLETETICLVGMASGDALERARRLQAESPEDVRVFQFAQAASEGAMLTAGFEAARGEILFTLPARFEVDLSVLSALYEAIAEGADVAFASRAPDGPAFSARLQSRLFNKIIAFVAGSHFRDVASGTRALRKDVPGEIPLYGEFHRYLPVLADRLGFRVREIPAQPDPRERAPLLHHPRVYLWRAIDILSIFFVSRFTRHPLRLFGGVGSLFGAVGAVILLIAAIQRLQGTSLADRPILVLGTLLVGLGFQSFTIGLLGELLLFFQGRGVRDYRIAAIYEADRGPLSSSSDAPSDRAAPAGSERRWSR